MNLADIAYANHKKDEELEIQRRIVIARDLYEGYIDNALLSQLDDALPGSVANINALFNAYAVVIEEVLNRLHIKQWVDAPENGQPVQWANEAWQDLNMDEVQFDIFEAALLDGEAFVILAPEYDPSTQKAKLKPFVHTRWTSAEVGGDNQGCKAHYDNGRLSMVSKRWIENYYDDKGTAKTRQRMTLYIAADGITYKQNVVEKYEVIAGALVPYDDGSGEAILWPHAYNVIHFRNVGDRLQGSRAQGPQILIDNLFADLATASGLVAGPMLVVIGGYPTTDGKPPAVDRSNVWKTGPGQIIGYPDKTPNEASITASTPGSLTEILHAIDKTVVMTSLTTGATSLMANLISGSQISAEFLKQTDIRPVAATRVRQAAFGNAMSRLMKTYSMLSKSLNLDPTGDPAQPLHADWLAADVRGLQPADGDEAAEAAAEAGKSGPSEAQPSE